MTVSPDQRILQFLTRAERVVLCSLLIILVLLVVIQGLLTYPQARLFLSSFTEAPEPLPAVAIPGEGKEFGTLKIKVLGYQALRHAYVLVNNKRVTNFTNPEVQVIVRHQDQLAIDGSFYQRPLTFRVTGASREVLSPSVGQEVTTLGSRESLGKVRLY